MQQLSSLRYGRISAALLVASWVAPATAGTQVTDRARIQAAVDSIVGEALKGGRAAGMSVGVVRGEPFDFAPGEALVYNNSAYFLLGLVIEKVTGGSYADYVKKNLFERAGMPDSRYCNEREILKRRAHGYDAGPTGLLLKAFIDHTWPYAAGSLCATAWDLVAWTQALHGGRILSTRSYEELTTPGTLNDGTGVRYAKGLVIDSLAGHRVIQHGGGINGFLSDVAWFPDERLSIVVLVNTAGPVQPGGITSAIAGLVLGRREPRAAVLDHPATDYVGDFKGVGRGESLLVKVSTDTSGVRLQIGRGQPVSPRYVGNDTFMVGRNRVAFVREGGRVTRARADLVSVVSYLRKL